MKSLTIEEFKDRVYSKVGSEYIVVGDYTGANNPIEMIHKECGHYIKMTPNNFFHHGKRCIYCSGSRGEKEVAKWLTKSGIKFEREYKFDDCKHQRVLPFDFAVFDENNEIITMIEFHGVQHYQSVKGWGGRGKLERAQLTDGIKSDYCLSNNINLLVIPYWNFDNIDSILKEWFAKCKNTREFIQQ